MTTKVFGLGQCCLDYIGKIPSYPPPDTKCEFSDLFIQGGGPVATAMVALARWGVSCAFAGVVVLAVIGFFWYQGILWIQKIHCPWRQEIR